MYKDEIHGKLIVFEGISGAGKSTLINELTKENDYRNSVTTNWFSLNKFRQLASEIDKYEKMTPQLYSLIYALEFYARYESIIEPFYKNGSNVIAHRYIYTPLSHDSVRGTETNYLKFLYGNVMEPDIVFFINLRPDQAYQRIIKYRRPTFFECGLDVEYMNNLELGFRRFKEGYFSDTEVQKRYLDFQEKVYENYMDVLPNRNTVIIDGSTSISEQSKNILNKIM